ncbi:hypothetical protein NLJ89_g5397 [Agrocybe chaxingu]|uniref:F-box domain-containing protein n=1 Tax=Agrocybe chaxingu TaxID=84603 RepID=A0A9W8K0P7_9AGAR|nr:hypothetical protein NLJ89_g5397 [Agrocybe chaxingu]
MTPPRFISLAPELIHAVADELFVGDLKGLRLTCRQLAYLLSAQVLRKLVFDFNFSNLEASIEKLEILSKGCPAAVQGTKELVLRSLSVDINRVPKGHHTPESLLFDSVVQRCLFRALSSLKSVRSIRWSPSESDSDWIQTTVLAALAELPNLTRINIDIEYWNASLPMRNLQGLTEIALWGGCSSPSCCEAIIDNIAKLIAHSPRLSSLSVELWQDYFAPLKDWSFQHLLQEIPNGNPPLSLMRLRLRGAVVSLDSATLSHLRNLVSLDLQAICNLEDTSAFPPGFIHSPQDDIWVALSSSGIWLEKIKLDFVTDSFLEYLASYSGLKALYVIPENFLDDASADEMAVKFYGSGLLSHVQSLEWLEILPRNKGRWCFSSENASFIANLGELSRLHMKVTPSNLIIDKDQRNLVELFINTAVGHLSRLENLHISPVLPRQRNVPRCGFGLASLSRSTYEAVIKEVEKYRAPPAFSRLPLLMANRVLFKEEMLSMGLRSGRQALRYVRVAREDYPEEEKWEL